MAFQMVHQSVVFLFSFCFVIFFSYSFFYCYSFSVDLFVSLLHPDFPINTLAINDRIKATPRQNKKKHTRNQMNTERKRARGRERALERERKSEKIENKIRIGNEEVENAAITERYEGNDKNRQLR